MFSERLHFAETVKLVRAQRRGRNAKRDYKATVVAAMKLENAFLFPRLLVLSFEERLWVTIPASCASVRFRALAFRLISRIGCGVEELLCEFARHWQTKRYRLLVDGSLWTEFTKASDCMMDAESQDIQDMCPDELDEDAGERMLTWLEFRQCQQEIGIAALESNNTAVRRLVYSRRSQKHSLSSSNDQRNGRRRGGERHRNARAGIERRPRASRKGRRRGRRRQT